MTTAEGGICVPLIVSGLDVQRGKIDTSNLMHVTDLFPTVLDYVGISRPDVYRGKKLAPLYGKSLRATFSSETPSRTDNEAICFEMAESKAVIKGQWKATLLLPPYGDGMHWKLYDIIRNYSEKKDLSHQYTDKLKELVSDWERYATSVGYISSDGTHIIEEIGAEDFYEIPLHDGHSQGN